MQNRCSSQTNTHHVQTRSERKQPTPLFPSRIKYQRTQKQPNANPNSNLHHTIPYVKDRTRVYCVCPCRVCPVGGVEKALCAVVDDTYTSRIACYLLSRDEARHETTGGCKATWYLEERNNQ